MKEKKNKSSRKNSKMAKLPKIDKKSMSLVKKDLEFIHNYVDPSIGRNIEKKLKDIYKSNKKRNLKV